MLVDWSGDLIQKLLEYVLDEYGITEGQCPQTLGVASEQQCVACNRQSYYGGGSPLYDCANFRTVYLIRFLVSHTKQTYDIIANTIASDIRDTPLITVASLGGGPATEALALAAQLNRNLGREYSLQFFNFDRESLWEPVCVDLLQALSSWASRVTITSVFSHYDVTDAAPSLDCDIVFVPWVLSEMTPPNRGRVLSNARDMVRQNGHVVITDRPETALVAEVSALQRDIGGWALVGHESEYCGVQFPDAVRDAFWVQLNYNTAYWVLRKA